MYSSLLSLQSAAIILAALCVLRDEVNSAPLRSPTVKDRLVLSQFLRSRSQTLTNDPACTFSGIWPPK